MTIGPTPNHLLKPGEYTHTIVTVKESEFPINKKFNDKGIEGGDNYDDDVKSSDLNVDRVSSQSKLFHLSNTESMLETRDTDAVGDAGSTILYSHDFDFTDTAHNSKRMR